jgi:hypothetical protein
LEAHSDGSVQTLLYAYHGFAHSHPDIQAIDLKHLSAVAQGIVIGHLSLFDVAQNRR